MITQGMPKSLKIKFGDRDTEMTLDGYEDHLYVTMKDVDAELSIEVSWKELKKAITALEPEEKD